MNDLSRNGLDLSHWRIKRLLEHAARIWQHRFSLERAARPPRRHRAKPRRIPLRPTLGA